MSWLFSRSLIRDLESSRCSRALVAEYSAATSSAGGRSAPLSVMVMPQPFLLNGKTMDFLRRFPYGQTFEALTVGRGEELLTSFLAGFRAKTYRRPESVPALKVNGRAYGLKWQESSVRFDPSSRSWKTHLCLLEEVLPWSSVTLPKWGIMLAGVCSELGKPERIINEIASGFSHGMLLPTPVADGDRTTNYAQGGRALGVVVRSMLPTPAINGNDNRKGASATSGDGLTTKLRQMLPTPNVPNGGRTLNHVEWKGQTAYHKGKKVQVGLEAAVKMLPTPCATEARQGFQDRTRGKKGTQVSLTTEVQGGTSAQVGGSLNPQFVEWMMGWPLNWTSMEPLPPDTWDRWQRVFLGAGLESPTSEMGRSRPVWPWPCESSTNVVA